VFHKVSFYCYLFLDLPDRIKRFDILWKGKQKLLLKQSVLDKTCASTSDDINVQIFSSIETAISYIICSLRNLEIKGRVYNKLNWCPELPDIYQPWIHELIVAITQHDIKSFSLFGHLSKYRPQNDAKVFMRELGYLEVKSNPPHVYLFHDIIRAEIPQPDEKK
jgi:hypothetical protein